MRKILPLFIFLLMGVVAQAQVKGKVVDIKGEALRAVNIYLEDSFVGTTTNENGEYVLDLKKTGYYEIVFQYLGYKKQKEKVQITSFPYQLDVVLEEEQNRLDEVVIKSDENPANAIIRKAIEYRKKNKEKIQAYTADFYSKGNWTVKDMPKKILGQEVDEGGRLGLDSTGSGIIYLSETKSKIKYKEPDQFHEHILASKVSGSDNGFSLNSAADAEFSFYDNTISVNADLVSPIAGFAFSYYRYKLVSAFYDDKGHLINKIQVLPKREADRVFSGFIYIVENSWEIYGIELTTTGNSTQIPVIKELNFNQSFKYDSKEDRWVKISQDVNFSFKIFGISGTGQFIGVYSNYDFYPEFDKKSFSWEIMSYEKLANKKDSTFWEEIRPVPLTDSEIKDYVKKDSISKAHESKAYKDSIDKKSNKFNIGDLVFGYTYTNSFKNYHFSIGSPLSGIHFNTVQGWNVNLHTQFFKRNKEKQTYWKIYSDMDYGFADHRYRITGGFEKKFNNFSRPILTVEGGVKATEINDMKAIPIMLNDIANTLFERNYLKLYEKKYAQAQYSQELFNGFRIYSTLAFEERKALLNATDHVIRHDSNGGYTSNNPLAPDDFESLPFEKHHLGKLRLATSYSFGQKYYSYPDGKYNVPSYKFPTLYLTYETGFAASKRDYNFHQLQFSAYQELDAKNKGTLRYGAKIGKFFDADHISLVDYKHFKGNQFRVYNGRTLDQFNLMPYYAFSTNGDYAELHAEHNFEGFLLGKVPGVNKLGFQVVAGAHVLWTEGRKPYQEYSIGLDNLGFGLFRLLRVDYVHSIHGPNKKGAVIFGLKFLF